MTQPFPVIACHQVNKIRNADIWGSGGDNMDDDEDDDEY